MSDATNAGGSPEPVLLITTGLVAGAVVLGAAATQLAAWRVGYHPTIGEPLIGRLYAPWRWIAWR